MKKILKINFVLPPFSRITGGPLAILEYANRLIARGHEVFVTTYPDIMWSGGNPFPWFKFNGTLIYKSFKNKPAAAEPAGIKKTSIARLYLKGFKSVLRNLFRARELKRFAKEFEARVHRESSERVIESLLASYNLQDLVNLLMHIGGQVQHKESLNFRGLLSDVLASLYVMEVMPDCDLNIATYWASAFPVYLSGKGKPVYFMQHFEEIFFPNQMHFMLHRLGARASYGLPMYKVANSSWLQNIIFRKYGQLVPFSNNAIVLSDFNPMPKKSAQDGVIRIVTYSRPEDWKGFGDATAAMNLVKDECRNVEWNVFGYPNETFPPDNRFAPYTYHPSLSFKELGELYATSDIALCPPWYESFPLPPLEAMASRTAVVTTQAGTEDYAFNEINALTVKSRDPVAIAEALKRLIKDQQFRERLAEEGRKTAQEFNWDAATDKREAILLDIYHNRTEYDVFRSSSTGFVDGDSVDFDRAPRDIALRDGDLVSGSGGAVYVIDRGSRRHVTSWEVLMDAGISADSVRVVDDLTLFRIPLGSPVFSPIDLRKEIALCGE